jgi:hypothetical protein
MPGRLCRLKMLIKSDALRCTIDRGKLHISATIRQPAKKQISFRV